MDGTTPEYVVPAGRPGFRLPGGFVLSAAGLFRDARTWDRPPARAAAPVALLLALPLVMLLLNRAWIFPRPDTVDPWMYIGFFLHPQHHLAQFPSAYHGSRLPILLPGIFAYQLFPVVGATVLLHLAQYYASVFCLYFAVRRLAGTRAALLAAVLLGTNGMFLSAMGQGHADGFGIPYFLFTCLALTAACDSDRWRGWSLAAGAGAALVFFTNMAYAIHSLFFPWYLLALCGFGARRALARAGFAAAGFAAVTLALCGANLLLCGRPWFFLPSLRVSQHLLANSTYCTGGRFTWVLHAGWVLTPLLVLGCGLAGWRRGLFRRPGAVGLVGGLAGLFALLAGLEAGRLLHFLQFSFYCSMLLPVTFLTAGVLLAGWADGLPGGEYQAAVAVAAGAGVLAAMAGTAGGLTPWALVLAPAAVATLAVAAFRRPDLLTRYPAALAMGLLAVGNLLVGAGYDRFVTANPLERPRAAGDQLVGRWYDPMPGTRGDAPQPTRAQLLRATADALDLSVEHGARHHLMFWYDVTEPTGPFANAVCSAMMWDRRMISMHFPAPQNHVGEGARWGPDTKVVVISAPGRAVEAEADPAAQKSGLRAATLATYSFFHRGVPAQMTVLLLRPQ